MQKVHRIIWLLVVSALVLTACTPTPTPAPTAAPTTAPAQQPTAAPAQPTLVPTQAPPTVAASSGDAQKLSGQTWKWISATDNSGKITTVPNPDNYTLAFAADGTVQIKADCNNAQGTYTTDGSRMTITVGPMTKAACPLGSLSDQFITGLGGVAAYLFSGEQLILDWKADAGQMIFSGATTISSGDAQKLGSQTWKWISATDNSGKITTVPNPDNYTLAFATDGTVQIKADCNNAQGTYTTDGSRMTITVGPMTMAACPPGSLSDQFITGLGGVAAYLFSGEQLILDWKADAGQMLFSGVTTEAAPGTDPTWDRVQASGKIVVGTAADYAPFEYYKSDLKLDGFDIALMQKIAERLGLQVEFHDFAFDGLGSVLQLGQADVVAAAVSATPQRYNYVDFSNLYYVSTDAALATADSTLKVTSATDLADKKVGVQKGTVYETWANENIVFTSGSGGGVTTYQNADELLNAVKAKQIDVALLGKQPALSAQTAGGVKIVGESFAKQQYALALPKNSPTLKSKINQALNSLANDGTLIMLGKLYLNDETPIIQQLPSLVPEQPVTPATCLDGMAFVEDLSYDDQNLTAPPAVQPGEAFVKSWRIKNVGTCVWTPAYVLAFTYGNNNLSGMGGVPTPLTKNVNPGETYDMSVNLVAPKDPGTYTAVWNLHNAQDAAFGESLWVAVTVPGTPAVTVVPATTMNFDVKLMKCQNNPTPEKPGGITLTLQFQPTGGTAPYRYFDMDEGLEVPQTYDRPGSKGSATIVAFGVLSADGQGREKKIQFQPSTFGPAGCP